MAAYGNHPSITAATTLADKRLAAEALVNGTNQDAIDFMNGPAPSTGMNDVDFWIGGLAEQQSPFVDYWVPPLFVRQADGEFTGRRPFLLPGSYSRTRFPY